jgi:serine/threonine-protein kinase
VEQFGAWQLDALIAVGGVAEVWRARDANNDVYALKRLHTHLLRNDEATAQFAVEQRLTTTLPRHRNVVHGVTGGNVAGRPYIALELAPGEELRRIAAGMSRARAIEIVRTLCGAAAHLHAHGWVHGDINPANIIVDHVADAPDGVVLVDLGVIRAVREGGNVRGTHAYMAPEQVRGEAWTPATDVFAIGVVMWELLAGARLFHRGPTWLSLAAVVEAAVPKLPDPALDAIVQAALAKAVADRIATATDLAARIAQLVS